METPFTHEDAELPDHFIPLVELSPVLTPAQQAVVDALNLPPVAGKGGAV